MLVRNDSFLVLYQLLGKMKKAEERAGRIRKVFGTGFPSQRSGILIAAGTLGNRPIAGLD